MCQDSFFLTLDINISKVTEKNREMERIICVYFFKNTFEYYFTIFKGKV